MRGISWLAEQLSASQGLCSKNLCIYLCVLYAFFQQRYPSSKVMQCRWQVDKTTISPMTFFGMNRSTPKRKCPSALHLNKCHRPLPRTAFLPPPLVKWPSLRQLCLFTHCDTSHSMYNFTPAQYTQPKLMPPYLPQLRLSRQLTHLNGRATTPRRTYALAFSVGLYVVPSGENGIFVIF